MENNNSDRKVKGIFVNCRLKKKKIGSFVWRRRKHFRKKKNPVGVLPTSKNCIVPSGRSYKGDENRTSHRPLLLQSRLSVEGVQRNACLSKGSSRARCGAGEELEEVLTTEWNLEGTEDGVLFLDSCCVAHLHNFSLIWAILYMPLCYTSHGMFVRHGRNWDSQAAASSLTNCNVRQ